MSRAILTPLEPGPIAPLACRPPNRSACRVSNFDQCGRRGMGRRRCAPCGNADDGTKEWFVGAVLLESEEAREAGPDRERH